MGRTQPQLWKHQLSLELGVSFGRDETRAQPLNLLAMAPTATHMWHTDQTRWVLETGQEFHLIPPTSGCFAPRERYAKDIWITTDRFPARGAAHHTMGTSRGPLAQ